MKYKSHTLRTGRVSIPGTYYHIIICTHQRQPVLADDKIASIIFETFNWLETRNRLTWICIMIMPDHVHAIIELGDGYTLAQVLHSFKGFTANKINEYLSRAGTLWQAQYQDRAIRNETALKNMVDYCYANPLRKGLVKNAKDYPYWRCKYEMGW